MHLVELYLEELSKVRDKKTIERISYQLSKLENAAVPNAPCGVES